MLRRTFSLLFLYSLCTSFSTVVAQDSLYLDLGSYFTIHDSERIYDDPFPRIFAGGFFYAKETDFSYDIYKPAGSEIPYAPDWVGDINFSLSDALAPSDADFTRASFLGSDTIIAGYFSQTGLDDPACENCQGQQNFGRLFRRQDVDPLSPNAEALFVIDDDFQSYDFHGYNNIAVLNINGSRTVFVEKTTNEIRFVGLGGYLDDNILSNLKESNADNLEGDEPVFRLIESSLTNNNIATYNEDSKIVIGQGSVIILVDVTNPEEPNIEFQGSVEESISQIRIGDRIYALAGGSQKTLYVITKDFTLLDEIELPGWVSDDTAWGVLTDDPGQVNSKDVVSFVHLDGFGNTRAVRYKDQFKSELSRDQLTLVATGSNLIPTSFGYPSESYIASNGATSLTIGMYFDFNDDFPSGYASYNLVQTDRTEVSNELNSSSPIGFDLAQNYPNPFNPTTQINYTLPNAGFVKLEVRNSIGQKVATLVDQQKSAGNHSINFDATNFSSGVYFYTIESGNFRQTRKMLLIK